jgi:hypothetical protein
VRADVVPVHLAHVADLARPLFDVLMWNTLFTTSLHVYTPVSRTFGQDNVDDISTTFVWYATEILLISCFTCDRVLIFHILVLFQVESCRVGAPSRGSETHTSRSRERAAHTVHACSLSPGAAWFDGSLSFVSRAWSAPRHSVPHVHGIKSLWWFTCVSHFGWLSLCECEPARDVWLRSERVNHQGRVFCGGHVRPRWTRPQRAHQGLGVRQHDHYCVLANGDWNGAQLPERQGRYHVHLRQNRADGWHVVA